MPGFLPLEPPVVQPPGDVLTVRLASTRVSRSVTRRHTSPSRCHVSAVLVVCPVVWRISRSVLQPDTSHPAPLPWRTSCFQQLYSVFPEDRPCFPSCLVHFHGLPLRGNLGDCIFFVFAHFTRSCFKFCFRRTWDLSLVSRFPCVWPLRFRARIWWFLPVGRFSGRKMPRTELALQTGASGPWDSGFSRTLL